MARGSHTIRKTPKGVVVTAKNGLEVHLTRRFAKIRGEADQPYRNAAQAIGHVAEMFHLAEEDRTFTASLRFAPLSQGSCGMQGRR
jgi:hypothetical protein